MVSTLVPPEFSEDTNGWCRVLEDRSLASSTAERVSSSLEWANRLASRSTVLKQQAESLDVYAMAIISYQEMDLAAREFSVGSANPIRPKLKGIAMSQP